MRRVLCLLGGFLLVGCGEQTEAERIPPATLEMAMVIGVEHAQLENGRELYLMQCEKCHTRIQPGELEPEHWRAVLPHMAKHAKLAYDEEEDLLNYLMAACWTVRGADLKH